MVYLQIYKNRPNAIYTHSVLKGDDLYEVNIASGVKMTWRYIGKVDLKIYQVSGTLLIKPSIKMITILQRILQPPIKESFQTFKCWLNEADKNIEAQKKWLDNLNIKEYSIIVPPVNLKDIKKILDEQAKQQGRSSKEGMEEQWINDALSGKDIGTLGHEVIHALQGKTTDMFKNLPPLDYLGDPEVDWDNFEKDAERKKYYYSRPPEIMCFAWTYFINKDKEIKREYERIGGDVYKTFIKYVNKYSKDKNSEEWVNNFNKNKKKSTIKIDGHDLPIVIIPKEKWSEGKNDPTEFDSDNNVVRVRSDYDYKKDPLNWMKHELIHYLYYKKGIKDDGKEYPTNNTEKAAYIYQFKAFKKQGIKTLPDIGKKHHEQILKKYWDKA